MTDSKRYREAVPHWQEGLATAPVGEFWLLRMKQAYCLAQAGDHAAAVAAARSLADWPETTVPGYVDLARIIALATAAVPPEDARRAEYAQEALRLLRRAQAEGYWDSPARREAFPRDKVWEVFRSLPAFRAWEQEMQHAADGGPGGR